MDGDFTRSLIVAESDADRLLDYLMKQRNKAGEGRKVKQLDLLIILQNRHYNTLRKLVDKYISNLKK